MVKAYKILANCTGFEWDQGNLTKNWERHDVSSIECEQIFFNKPIIVKRDKGHSLLENRYYALGRTNMDRLLFVVFTVRNEKVRVISARDMTAPEIERYTK
ncbi:MAG: BrnT family toxin [Desulfobacteraceae bacterium]|nr:MAG: BrnT family toxin [Desulfobacteraceae bacterium]